MNFEKFRKMKTPYSGLPGSLSPDERVDLAKEVTAKLDKAVDDLAELRCIECDGAEADGGDEGLDYPCNGCSAKRAARESAKRILGNFIKKGL